MKRILFLILLASTMFAHANPLTVGIGNYMPPFSSAINGSNDYYGFCIDLMDGICARIHTTCQYKETEMGQKQLNDLRNGAIDITFLTSPLTTRNSGEFVLSLPFLPSNGQFLTNEANINTIEDLQGKRIGVLQATGLKHTFLNKYTNDNNIHEYAKMADLLAALNAHQVDAILMNASVAKYVLNNLQKLKLVGQPLEFGMGYGMITLRRNAPLMDKVNKALLEMESDGSYVAIYKKYFGV